MSHLAEHAMKDEVKAFANPDQKAYADQVPPTAMPADVYLEKLEKLLHENARLKSLIGQAIGVMNAVSFADNRDFLDDEWTEYVLDPLIELLRKASE